MATKTEIAPTYAGWWRIREMSQWDDLDLLGPALISVDGRGGRLRMVARLAYVTWKPTKTGLSFTWTGAWEFDQVSGTGTARIDKPGTLQGTVKIKNGDSSTFIAERTIEPDAPIPEPPSYRDKWSRSRRR